MEFKDSRTAQNLLKAFAGESQARNRYTFAAGIARNEGLQHVAAVFEETAGNERAHAGLFYATGQARPSALEITAGYPVVAGDSVAQLKAAVDGENEEWSALYPEFARSRRKKVSRKWPAPSSGCQGREGARSPFRALYDHLLSGTLFQRGEKVYWRCLECGHIHEGVAAPRPAPYA